MLELLLSNASKNTGHLPDMWHDCVILELPWSGRVDGFTISCQPGA